MAPGDITIKQGATFEMVVNWRDSDGDLVNLTGYSARMQGRATYASTATLFSLVSGTEITLTTPGVISIVIPAATTAAFTPGNYVYDLEMVNGATVYRILEGVCIVSPEVTR
jgi:hypothetical protein